MWPVSRFLSSRRAAGGLYERHDDYRVWQSTIYRHLAAPIRVYRIQR